jgi:hypothetical protein
LTIGISIPVEHILPRIEEVTVGQQRQKEKKKKRVDTGKGS